MRAESITQATRELAYCLADLNAAERGLRGAEDNLHQAIVGETDEQVRSELRKAIERAQSIHDAIDTQLNRVNRIYEDMNTLLGNSEANSTTGEIDASSNL